MAPVDGAVERQRRRNRHATALKRAGAYESLPAAAHGEENEQGYHVAYAIVQLARGGWIVGRARCRSFRFPLIVPRILVGGRLRRCSSPVRCHFASYADAS
jgi:hypothetical protein